ncbi:MAG: acetyl-CoA carboxylase subunit beta [Ignavibacteria bacterium RIFCSPLOWO2_02_FULL_55_14]|nr:MAG: acetyl-CoA carboxylase subunit beta [Ignavibacteria bacterium GWC2_56_12]OGU67828.1 MAG: acetyl-CoA carboxylase subunit beta [Ignavibacteria bacterium RIFCSPHIGHO2_02_FULL_56_12]OGU75637.1 MAG: acetyl-CoA carboxylase subunit beta [Ignavibacteria bacterium RIFCSPLOWO2_02_FULL_55_14]OGU76651.1 MAG: acetyl-CoA carboxylase subunit beta [Ignavibacteria bacterium RIFCSPLOWO2_12_FULL_56_21]
MAWFKRSKVNISSESQKKDMPDGMWTKCGGCGEIIHKKHLEQNLWTCAKCNYHFRIGSKEYFGILLDKGTFKEMDKGMRSVDPLKFNDSKPYAKRIDETIRKTGLHDAVRTGQGEMDGMPVVVACMDFSFIGGSMGSVVGEKVARAIDKARTTKRPLIVISSSGGARMMEGALSLMQLAKTSAKLAELSQAKVPYISVMTDPTTGGVTASFAMLGDVHVAEQQALIGFAGPRVIKQTIGKDLPAGFQRSEFLQEKGFIDLVVHRKELRPTLVRILAHLSS